MTPTARPAARTLPLGRVLGVPVDIAPSWLLFFGLVVVLYGPTLGERDGSVGGYLAAAAFAVLLLGSVLLHEVGHCVAARLLRLRVRRITVSFLAGLTEITDPPPTPGRAFAVSGAGPLVSVLLAAAGFAGLALLPDVGSTTRTVVGLFALSNAGLAVFNLLPGLPLDGGGLLRALVWRISGDPSTGTVVSAHAGRVLALAVLPLTALVAARHRGAAQPGRARDQRRRGRLPVRRRDLLAARRPGRATPARARRRDAVPTRPARSRRPCRSTSCCDGRTRPGCTPSWSSTTPADRPPW